MKFNVTTSQVTVILNLLETLGSLTNELTIHFLPEGMHIKFLKYFHETIPAIAYVHLNSDKFETYECTGHHIITFPLTDTYRMIKSSKNNDEITFRQEETEDDRFQIVFYNNMQKTSTEFVINLFMNAIEDILIPELNYESYIMMPSFEFFNKLKDMASVSKEVTIRYRNQTLQLEAATSALTRVDTLNLVENFLHTSNDTLEFEGTFSLTALMKLGKAYKINKTLILYMEERKPIVFLFAVSSLGTLRYITGPISEIH